MNPTPITFMDKQVGILRADRVFIARRTSKHFFRKFHGFGLSYSVIKKLRDLRCREIILLWEKRNGMTEKLTATPELFLDKGQYYRDGENDNQRILHVDLLREVNQILL